MAVLRIGQLDGAEVGPLGASRRWGKIIAARSDVDLGKPDGYAIVTPFVDWGSAAAVGPGQYAIYASRLGHASHVWLIGVDRHDEPRLIDPETIAAEVADAPLADAHKARAINSPLYAAAAYCWLHLDVNPVRIDPDRIATARHALAALTPAERRALLDEIDADPARDHGRRGRQYGHIRGDVLAALRDDDDAPAPSYRHR